MNPYKVFIVGHEGTTGLRIHERLSGRKDITLLSISDEDRKNIDVIASIAKTRISCSCACLMRPPKRWWLLLAIILARLSTHPQHLERLMIGPMAFPELGESYKNDIKRNNISQILAVMQAGMIACIAPLEKQALPQ